MLPPTYLLSRSAILSDKKTHGMSPRLIELSIVEFKFRECLSKKIFMPARDPSMTSPPQGVMGLVTGSLDLQPLSYPIDQISF